MEAGVTQTRVRPLTVENALREGVLLGQVAAGNPIPFIVDTLGWLD
ncbi:hypothetical protein ABZ816_30065 [Actinosynnema sp. NPDC047251]|uniref:Uncharacterized protein n=1 Tax=Saccharothrix espanaensis (strain ATCC 51144 / DSM 44229 / JCM 9112 / NBRC 15066 / NRRL 15764) TaxID=1179773 RepID=K0KDS1_SACES|nr:hypothetical protein [Saccharothrix espanaensis]CCH34673.1 hypothetical protein BN6_74460 [Saccharothrix espanaensis DSM 44229]